MPTDGKKASNAELSPETLTAQALGWIDEATGAIIPPIHTSTTYERGGDLEYPRGYSYSRSSNPTHAQLEAVLARLEGGADAIVVGAGMSAVALTVTSLSQGDHLLVQRKLYWGVRKWLDDFAGRFGLALEYVDTGDLDAVRRAVRPGETRLIWAESPANPTWEVADIAALAEIARGAGARLAVDSTAATPVLSRPIEYGADLVMHAGTKYLNGHGDVLAGVLVTAREDDWWARIKAGRQDLGTVLAPMEAWLFLRGLRTVHLRVRQASENALAVAKALEDHPKVSHVLYPGLESHPDHALARRQMSGGFGGMLSIRLASGRDAAVRTAAALKVFKRATSFGGVESLVEHRASIEGAGTPVPDDLLRLSMGIEDAGDLIRDLERALEEV